MMFRRGACLCLSLLLALSCLPAQWAYASVLEAEQPMPEEMLTFVQEDYPADELYEGYLESLFYENSIAFFGEAARERLGEKAQRLYDYLKENIVKIAAGEESSARIRITGEQFVSWGGAEHYEYPYASQTPSLQPLMVEFEFSAVLSALLHDCPYELYWFDKVTGMKMPGSAVKYDDYYEISYVNFNFSVVQDHRPSDYDASAPTVDTANAAAASAAAEKAKLLVEKHAGKNDYQKLKAYKEEICSLVSYNKGVSANQFSLDADPWQLIWVFDGNQNTNVVCEGYSKAFQYLFDNSQFSSGVDCYTVTGKLISTKTEGHMWNIVTLDGKNYLTDITNSDSGTAGQDGSLFLAGGTGSIAEGYAVGSVSFTYDSNMTNLWGTGDGSILTLAEENYDPCAKGHTEVTDPAVEASCSQSGLTEGKHCTVCGEVMVKQTVIPASGEHSYVDGTCQVCGQNGGKCGENLSWILDKEGTLFVFGSGEMDFGEESASPWKDFWKQIKAVELESGITSIADYAFDGMFYLETVTIPDTVTSIGDFAFYGCANLADLTLPENLTSIGDYAFDDCQEITSIVFPEGIIRIGEYAFWSCTGLTEMTFEGSAPQIIGENAFQYVTATAWYPANDSTWTSEIMQDYGGKITWKTSCASHIPVTDPAVEPTCTETGLTEGSHCSACGEILQAQQVVPANGHTEKTIPGKAATCTEDGLTEGKACSICGEITEAQTILVKQGHKETILNAKAATCTETGLTEGKQCTVCGEITKEQTITAKLKHTAVTDKKVAATCGKSGLTEGSHCSVCGYVIQKQETIPATGNHSYTDKYDTACNSCGHIREVAKTTPMYRMYDPNSSEHFYTGSTDERDILVEAGWNYEGVGFNFPLVGEPVHRLYEPVTGEHLYTMDEAEMNTLLASGWNYEGVAFNSAEADEVPQYRLHNPNATRGAYHFTGATEERDHLISLGWEYQGIGWYSCLK